MDIALLGIVAQGEVPLLRCHSSRCRLVPYHLRDRFVFQNFSHPAYHPWRHGVTCYARLDRSLNRFRRGLLAPEHCPSTLHQIIPVLKACAPNVANHLDCWLNWYAAVHWHLSSIFEGCGPVQQRERIRIDVFQIKHANLIRIRHLVDELCPILDGRAQATWFHPLLLDQAHNL